MKPEFIVLALILLGAIYLFWTQRLRTEITALLVMLSLALPWPRPDSKWSAILSPQEAFSGFGSVAVIMVTAMFVFSAAMVRTGAALDLRCLGGTLHLGFHRGEQIQCAARYHHADTGEIPEVDRGW